jgi:hypothetical protein
VPVIINEIEVLEPPVPSAPASGAGLAPAAPAIAGDRVLRLLLDAGQRQRRLVAD